MYTVHYFNINFLRVNQHLLLLLYISRYITFFSAIRRTSGASSGSLIFIFSIFGPSTAVKTELLLLVDNRESKG